MTQSDHIRKFLDQNGLMDSCGQARKAFVAETGIQCYYSAFQRVYKQYTVDKGTGQTKRMTYDTVTKHDRNRLPYQVWKDIPEQHKVQGDNCQGTKVIVAGEGRGQYEVKQYHLKGEPGWPHEDGVTVAEFVTGGKKSFTQYRYFPIEQVRVHPEVLKRKEKADKKARKKKTEAA